MMSETKILTDVINYFNENCSPFSPISLGGLSPNNSGISAEIAPGYAKSSYLDGGALQRLPVLFLIRNGKHKTAMETAFSLAAAAREITINGEKIHEKIAGISIGSAPEFVQRNGADFIYSLIINVDYITD
jgi:hypothetical protein